VPFSYSFTGAKLVKIIAISPSVGKSDTSILNTSDRVLTTFNTYFLFVASDNSVAPNAVPIDPVFSVVCIGEF
jgi:hypothetical protein